MIYRPSSLTPITISFEPSTSIVSPAFIPSSPVSYPVLFALICVRTEIVSPLIPEKVSVLEELIEK